MPIKLAKKCAMASNLKTVTVTKLQCLEGITLKLDKYTIVKVLDWTNKKGTDVLFQAPKTGVYKIKGKVPDYAS